MINVGKQQLKPPECLNRMEFFENCFVQLSNLKRASQNSKKDYNTFLERRMPFIFSKDFLSALKSSTHKEEFKIINGFHSVNIINFYFDFLIKIKNICFGIVILDDFFEDPSFFKIHFNEIKKDFYSENMIFTGLFIFGSTFKKDGLINPLDNDPIFIYDSAWLVYFQKIFGDKFCKSFERAKPLINIIYQKTSKGRCCKNCMFTSRCIIEKSD